jgi:UV DNA damage endonuclease
VGVLTIVRLGYVAMSVHLQNSSPSQTMTFAQFSKLKNREAAIKKLGKLPKAIKT